MYTLKEQRLFNLMQAIAIRLQNVVFINTTSIYEDCKNNNSINFPYKKLKQDFDKVSQEVETLTTRYHRLADVFSIMYVKHNHTDKAPKYYLSSYKQVSEAYHTYREMKRYFVL